MPADNIWTAELGEGPIVATAVHDGHQLRGELMNYIVLPESDRLREEDPFTGPWTSIAPSRIIATRSRFEVDLNRPRENAVYRTPDDAWGLVVWKQSLPEDVAHRSLVEYDLFYEKLKNFFDTLSKRHGYFLVLDLHTYNHRRQGPDGPPADARENPQVNVGTGTMLDRAKWAPVIDCFVEKLAQYDFPTGKLDVRENIKFRGGQLGKWAHTTFPESACVLSVEFKKFFMDEWNGTVDPVLHQAIADALKSTVPDLLRVFETLP